MVNGSSVEFFGHTLPDGTISATTIKGHSGPGVNVVRSSGATFNGPHLIRGNGSTSAALRSGIRVEHSNVTLNGTTVSGNTGPGIVAEESSTVNVLAGAVIRNNTEDGVRLEIQSNGGLFQPISIFGNGEASVSCDRSSLAFGDFTGIRNVNCGQLESTESGATKGRVVAR